MTVNQQKEAELKKVLAEAELAELDLEKARFDLEKSKYDHEVHRQDREMDVRRKLAEVEQAELEREQNRLTRDVQKLDLMQRTREEDFSAAHPDITGNFSFTQVVDENSVGFLRAKLLSFSKRNPGEPIEINLCSPGGSVFDGFNLYSTLRHLSEQGHHITMVASGLAASMAAILLQAGDHRVMSADSMLLIHESSSLAVGKAGDIKDKAEFMEKLTRKVCELFARRSHLSAEEIYDFHERRDWWIWPDEALEYGFIDEVRPQ